MFNEGKNGCEEQRFVYGPMFKLCPGPCVRTDLLKVASLASAKDPGKKLQTVSFH